MLGSATDTRKTIQVSCLSRGRGGGGPSDPMGMLCIARGESELTKARVVGRATPFIAPAKKELQPVGALRLGCGEEIPRGPF